MVCRMEAQGEEDDATQGELANEAENIWWSSNP